MQYRYAAAVQSKASSVTAYLSELPADRREAISAVREVILKNLDKDFEEGMQYGMIGYYVPHRVYPAGYHCDPRRPLPFAGLASQKNHMSFYLMSVYGSSVEEKWLREQFAKAGKKLDMGKGCIRFRKLEDLPLDVIGEAIRRVSAKAYIAYYESAIRGAKRPSGTAKRQASGKTLARKAVAKSGTATRRAGPAKKKRRRG